MCRDTPRPQSADSGLQRGTPPARRHRPGPREFRRHRVRGVRDRRLRQQFHRRHHRGCPRQGRARCPRAAQPDQPRPQHGGACGPGQMARFSRRRHPAFPRVAARDARLLRGRQDRRRRRGHRVRRGQPAAVRRTCPGGMELGFADVRAGGGVVRVLPTGRRGRRSADSTKTSTPEKRFIFPASLKRWGRAKGLGFRILRDTPVVTSARKMEWYGQWQLLGRCVMMMRPGAVKSRAACSLWYTRPEEKNLAADYAD